MVGSGYKMNVLIVHSCGISIPCKVQKYFLHFYFKANTYMVGYIVRNKEVLKNTIEDKFYVHRGHFGGYLLIHQGNVGRNI